MTNARKISFIVDDNGCFNCTSHKPVEGGYRHIMIKGTLYKMHRFIYEQCFGEIPNGLVIRHKCDNPHCINPEHLLSGTHLDNARDRVERGRNNSPIGSQHGRSKLKEHQIFEIYDLLSNNDKLLKPIADKYGVANTTILKIKKGAIWKHSKVLYDVFQDVKEERARQVFLYGIQEHPNTIWLPILMEEVGEVAEALQIDTKAAKDTDADDLYTELTQVAAVAISWAAQLKEGR